MYITVMRVAGFVMVFTGAAVLLTTDTLDALGLVLMIVGWAMQIVAYITFTRTYER